MLERRDAENLKDFMQAWLQFQRLLEDRNQEVSAQCSPDLDTHGVLAGADKGPDAQVSLDPFEKQLSVLRTTRPRNPI